MTVDPQEQENLLSDEDFENWATISEGFGEKIVWDVGTVFIGEYTGIQEIESEKFTGPSLTFRDKNGEKHYSWLTHQLKEVVDSGAMKEGNIVRIQCVKEEKTDIPGRAPVKVFKVQVKPGT